MKALAGEASVTEGERHAVAVKASVALIVSLLVVLAAACSGSSSKASPSPSQPTSTGPALTKPPILIGEVGPFSGAQSSLGGEELPKAWEQWTNTHGGVNGHPVKMVFGDDQSTGALDSSLVKKLVQTDHVVAFLAVGTADNEALSFLTEHNIPLLQSTTTTAANTFALTASQTAVTAGLMQSAKLAGVHKVGVFYCTVASFCQQAVDPFEAAAEKLGLDHSFKVGISFTSPNYTAECFAAKDDNVEALFAEADATTVQKIAQQCATQGYRPIYLLDGVQASLSMDQVQALNGARTIVTTFPWFEDDTPATQAFQQAIQQNAPSLLKSTQFGPATALSWASAQAIARAAQLGNVGDNPTSAEILAGLHKFKNETLGGLIAPVTWKPNQTSLTNCYFVVATKDGKWVAPNGYGPQCQS
jgi:branched-chain amino acid transport system substrate-binding protein